MADQVPDNHDRAHEVMTEGEAIERGQNLAQVNHEAEQARLQESRDEAARDRGGLPPENNFDNGHADEDRKNNLDSENSVVNQKAGDDSSKSKKSSKK